MSGNVVKTKKEMEPGVEAAANPLMAWIYKHHVLSANILTLIMGLAMGGVFTVLDRVLV